MVPLKISNQLREKSSFRQTIPENTGKKGCKLELHLLRVHESAYQISVGNSQLYSTTEQVQHGAPRGSFCPG